MEIVHMDFYNRRFNESVEDMNGYDFILNNKCMVDIVKY
jgi:tRNA A37 threonylcarbamoyladenosine biosynthesis protein TsaE